MRTHAHQQRRSLRKEEIDYYNDLHKHVFGREIPQVMLLYANRLNAELIDKLLQIFVMLDQAQSTPPTRRRRL